MESGKLNERITIKSHDGLTSYDVWCNVRPVTTREQLRNSTVLANNLLTLQIRYLKDINNTFKVIYQGYEYDIVNITSDWKADSIILTVIMNDDTRTTIKSWIERIVGSGVSVFCDFVPDYESSQSVVCFNLQDVELTRTLDMSSTLFWATVKIIISSRNRADADAVVDSLLDQSFDDDDTSGIKNIFFESLHDLDFDPDVDYFYSSVLTLKLNIDVID